MVFKSWLRRWKTHNTVSQPIQSRQPVRIKPKYSSLVLEELESRVVLNTVTWTGGAGTLNWGDAANWSTGSVPNSSSAVTISLSGVGTINVGSGTFPVASLTDTTAALSIASGGTLSFASGATTSTLGENVAIESGGTLSIAAGVTLSLGSNTTLTDYGSLTFAASSTATFAYTFGDSTQIIVENGGSMTATNTQFATPDFFNFTDEITVDNGGQIQVSNSTFTLSELTLDNSLSSGNLNADTFNCPLYLPASDIPYLSGTCNNNVSFETINILAGGVSSGTLALNLIGTGSTASLDYNFSANFTIESGATLSIASGVSVSVTAGQTITDYGSVNFAGNNTLTFQFSAFDTTELIVENGGSISVAATQITQSSAGNDTTELVVESGGQIQASNCNFSITEVALNNNLSSGD